MQIDNMIIIFVQENWEPPAWKSEKQKSDATLKQKPDTSSVNLTASLHLNKNPKKVSKSQTCV